MMIVVAGLAGGCPPLGGIDAPRIPGAPDAGGDSDAAPGGGGAPAGQGDTAVPGSTPTAGTAVGDSYDSVWDGLTVEFAGCYLPQQAAFWQSEVLRLVNQERRAADLAPVVWNATLAAQATQYACEMITYGFFAHENPVTGSTLAERTAEFQYEYWIVGENLAAGQPNPVRAVTDWMGSPGHRENILNPAFTELGVGVRTGGSYGIYWVQEFGRPLAAGPPEGRSATESSAP